jgi:hypothetical protein
VISATKGFFMKSFAVAIAAAGLVVTSLCRADDQAAPSPPLKAAFFEFSGQQFAGSVVWSTHNVESAPHLAPTLAVRADIEIPNLGMALKVELRHSDHALPFSHTVELVFTLPPDFPHGEVAGVPGLLMKAGETTGGDALQGVSAKVADNLFVIGLSNDEADRQRNVQLMTERPWLDVQIVYSDGQRAVITVEKPEPGERALAVLGPTVPIASGQPCEAPAVVPEATIESANKDRLVPIDHLLPGAIIKPWPFRDAWPSEWYASLNQILEMTSGRQLAALPSTQPREPLRPKLTLPALERPTWAWPPGRFWWALAPGLPSVSWTWQAGWQPVLPEMVRIASRIELPSALQARLPAWVRDTSAAMVAAGSAPPWPQLRAPDFRIPTGPSRFTDVKNLEPPRRFVRWSDRLETVLADGHEVNRRCRAALGKPPPAGKVYRGCARGAAGRCFITRIDDPGVARHELAHCNGWKHPE